MGNPKIYFYPDSDGSLETIDFGEPLSDLQITHRRDVIDGYTRAGAMSRTSGRSYLEVRIILQNFTNLALLRQLETLSAHLERGNPIGFTLDNGKVFGAFIESTSGVWPKRGATAVQHRGNRFDAWESSNSLGGGDTVIISSSPPAGLRETRRLSSVSSTYLRMTSDPLVYTHKNAPIVGRERDFYPALIMPEDQVGTPIVTTNHRISYTLDMTLAEDWGTLTALDSISAPLRDTEGLPSSGVSLQEAVSEYRSQLNDAWIPG